MNSSYLRFLALVHALDTAPAHLSTVDVTAKLLLDVVAVNHANGSPMTVSDAMALSAIASPATVHRKLDDLRESGLIEQVFEGKNRRTKYLVPTAAAGDYYAHLDTLMRQALDSH